MPINLIHGALTHFHRKQLTHKHNSQPHSMAIYLEKDMGLQTPWSEFTLLGSEQFNKRDVKLLINGMWKSNTSFHREQLIYEYTSQPHSTGQPREGHHTVMKPHQTLRRRGQSTHYLDLSSSTRDIKLLTNGMWKFVVDVQTQASMRRSHPKCSMLNYIKYFKIQIKNSTRQFSP